MTAQQKLKVELKHAYLALAFCQNREQTKMVEANIDELEEELAGYVLDLVDVLED